MKRLIMIVLGGFLSLLGVILMVSPFPMGFVLIFLGLGLIIMHSPRAAAWLRLNRTYNDVVDKQADLAAKACPPKLRPAPGACRDSLAAARAFVDQTRPHDEVLAPAAAALEGEGR